MVNICIPTLNRYDLLRQFLLSLKNSTVTPSAVHIVDNGRKEHEVQSAIADTIESYVHFEIFIPRVKMGLAETWNWFIKNVPQTRIICNDDLVFGEDTIAALLSARADFVTPGPIAGSNAFSCFVQSDDCLQKVGLFDESISPGYAYFEDCDYAERMKEMNFRITPVECNIQHVGSQTLHAFDEEQTREHHRKFKIARENFRTKWGRLPAGVQE